MRALEKLYEADFYAWTRSQARALRQLRSLRLNVELDLDHLAQEVRDLGSFQRDTCRSEVERILQHFLKLRYSPASQPRRGWRLSVVEARSVLEKKLSRTLRADLRRSLPGLYRNARRAAVLGLEAYEEAEAARLLPEPSPFSLDDVLCDDWYPEPPPA